MWLAKRRSFYRLLLWKIWRAVLKLCWYTPPFWHFCIYAFPLSICVVGILDRIAVFEMLTTYEGFFCRWRSSTSVDLIFPFLSESYAKLFLHTLLSSCNLSCNWVRCICSLWWGSSGMTVCSYHVTYAFQSESTLYSCLNVSEILLKSRHEIWSISDCNLNRTHYHLVHKRTLNHLVKLAKWLSCIDSTYLYGEFHCIFLSCHGRISKWVYTL